MKNKIKKINNSKPEELIHVKLNYSEAVDGKRQILNSEASFLYIAKSMKKYQILRQEELKVKLKIHKKMAETTTLMKKITILLPQIKIPEHLHHGKQEDKIIGVQERIKQATNSGNYNDIESQLREIQNRLKSMG